VITLVILTSNSPAPECIRNYSHLCQDFIWFTMASGRARLMYF
jgi:hypothetical protein